MKTLSPDLKPGDVIRISSNRVRRLETRHEFDDSESTYVRALPDEPAEIELVVRMNYPDTMVRCIVVGTGLLAGEYVGTFHSSTNEEIEVVR